MTTVVVGLRRPRAGDPTVEVVLESGERVRVHDRRLSEHGLRAGAALDAAPRRGARAGRRGRRGRAALAAPDRPPAAVAGRARPPAWRGGGFRARMRRGCSTGCAAMGVIDDAALAAAVVSSPAGERVYGRLRIEADLDRLEVDPAAVSAARGRRSAEAEVERARRALGARRTPGCRRPGRPPAGGGVPGPARLRRRDRRGGARPRRRRLIRRPPGGGARAVTPLPNRPALVYDPCRVRLCRRSVPSPAERRVGCTGSRLRSVRAQASPPRSRPEPRHAPMRGGGRARIPDSMTAAALRRRPRT